MTRLSVSIDRGGTFTDCIALDLDSGKEWVVKLLSVDPENYDDAPTEGIRRLLELSTGVPLPRRSPLPIECLQSIRMATTVATNALLERTGERCALLITKGFSDALQIGTQARPHIFDLTIETLDVLYERVIEVDERLAYLCHDSHMSMFNARFLESRLWDTQRQQRELALQSLKEMINASVALRVNGLGF
jgi:5-oxoprolinase (ATP-hydrolysing)